jgi:hypothetical protein
VLLAGTPGADARHGGSKAARLATCDPVMAADARVDTTNGRLARFVDAASGVAAECETHGVWFPRGKMAGSSQPNAAYQANLTHLDDHNFVTSGPRPLPLAMLVLAYDVQRQVEFFEQARRSPKTRQLCRPWA